MSSLSLWIFLMEIIMEEKIFEQYIKQFKDEKNSDKYNWKIEHSYRVAKICHEIALKEGDTPEEVRLATICGLFHDIGRFSQISKYNSYNDHTTKDHGVIGYNILSNERLLEKVLYPEDEIILMDSTLNHNQYQIASSVDSYTSHFCKIVRDADKIDILRGMIEGNIHYKSNNHPISYYVKEDIINNQLVNWKHIKGDNDHLAECFSFAFDINFETSKKIIKDDDLFTKLYDTIPSRELFKNIKSICKRYIESSDLNVEQKI